MNRRTSAWVHTHAPAGTRWGTKTLSLLLSLALCLGLLPGAAMAADTGATKEIAVKIEWDAHEGVELPDSETVALFKGKRAEFNKAEKVSEVTLSAANDWKDKLTVSKDAVESDYFVAVTKIGDEDTNHQVPGQFDFITVTIKNSKTEDVPLGTWNGEATGSWDKGYTVKNIYEATKYTISYEFEDNVKPDGVELPESQDYTADQEYTIAAMPEVSGWTFDGWYHWSDRYDANQKLKVADTFDRTYSGKWTKNEEPTTADVVITTVLEGAPKNAELDTDFYLKLSKADENGTYNHIGIMDRGIGNSKNKFTYTGLTAGKYKLEEINASFTNSYVLDHAEGTEFEIKESDYGKTVELTLTNYYRSKNEPLSVDMDVIEEDRYTIFRHISRGELEDFIVNGRWYSKDMMYMVWKSIGDANAVFPTNKAYAATAEQKTVIFAYEVWVTSNYKTTVTVSDENATYLYAFRELYSYGTGKDVTVAEDGKTVTFEHEDGGAVCLVFARTFKRDENGNFPSAAVNEVTVTDGVNTCTDTETVAITEELPDIEVTKEVTKIVRNGMDRTDKATAGTGDTITYTITITNNS